MSTGVKEDVVETIGGAVPFLFPKPSNPNNVSVTFPLLNFVAGPAALVIIGGLIAGTKGGPENDDEDDMVDDPVVAVVAGLFIAFATAIATAVGVAEELIGAEDDDDDDDMVDDPVVAGLFIVFATAVTTAFVVAEELLGRFENVVAFALLFATTTELLVAGLVVGLVLFCLVVESFMKALIAKATLF